MVVTSRRVATICFSVIPSEHSGRGLNFEF